MRLNNTAKRILVAVLAIPLILVLCLLGGIPFAVFVSALGLGGFYELSLMAEKKGISIDLFTGFFSIIIILLFVYTKRSEFYVPVLFIGLILSLRELFRGRQGALENIGSGMFGIFYIGMFSSSIIMIREFYSDSILYPRGGQLILGIMICIWLCDSAAFFIGSALGRHKLFKRVSPNKSWEGAIAGFIFSVLGALFIKTNFLSFLSWQDALAIGAITGIFGQIGDLVESLLKRDCGVKDSSNLIPGHGGIFDRFDSLLYSAPLIYLYMHFTMK